MLENVIQSLVEVLFRGLSGTEHRAVQQGLGSGIVFAFHGYHGQRV